MHLIASTLLLVAIAQAAPAPLPFGPDPPQRVTITARIEPPAPARGAPSLVIEATPQPGIHVYAPGNASYIPVSVEIDRADGVRPGKAIFPAGQPYVFGDLKEVVQVYSRPFAIRQPLLPTGGAHAGPIVITGRVRYQACDDRICFPAVKAPFTATLAGGRTTGAPGSH